MAFEEFNVEDLVEFKGTRSGIIVNVKKVASFDEIKQSIINRIESSIGFFNGAKIGAINCNYLTDIQIMQIKEDIACRFDVEFVEDDEDTKRQLSVKSYMTKYISNMRSGDNIQFDGDVVVMGDMKPGSQILTTGNVVVMGDVVSGCKIVAYGNVTVMGKLEGFIHAGAYGNTNSYIVSNNLNPKILKIAQYIAEAPDDESSNNRNSKPEIAFVNNNMIVIESYESKNLR